MELFVLILIVISIFCIAWLISSIVSFYNIKTIIKENNFDPKLILKRKKVVEWMDKNGISLKNKFFNLMLSSDGKFIGLQYQNLFWLEELKKYTSDEITFSITNKKEFSLGSAIGTGLTFSLFDVGFIWSVIAGIVAGDLLPKNQSYMRIKTPNESILFAVDQGDMRFFMIFSDNLKIF